MEVSQTSLPGVKLIKPYVFEDHRGRYIEIYNEQEHTTNLFGTHFVQDDVSVSMKHVLRGIHGDDRTVKLISCLYGTIYLVVVSPEIHKIIRPAWESFVLSGENGLQVFIPAGHGVAHLVLSDAAVFHYKQSTYYNREKQFTYRYDDPRLNIWWPVNNPILSRRDSEN